MKSFRYSMQSILDYRRDLEEEEKLKFAQAQKEYLKQKEILEGVERKLDDAFSARIKKKYRIHELKNLSEYIHLLKERKDMKKKRVEESERNLEIKRQQLISAQKDRKIMEKHKEKAYEQYNTELNQEEQKIIDELALYSYYRR